ncbi:patatin-like phospholipase domain-containing protein 2 [Toxotes jaculatrix]|uniref:patatin-like phospholipase domain-containing protein 2 n=1 Tax=Toxotes jaculatrix TaxID=941984 RepID=UPI001B3A8F38|nr:patatin-like phospholipase domain-containing protein 2 [Toxotes jaculatrix]
MAPGVSSCHYGEVPLSISFSGSGFMSTYQLGVAQCLLNYAPWILRTAPCVLGASAGSLVAAAVVCEMNLITVRDEIMKFAKEMKAFTLGPFNPSVNLLHWLEYVLRKHLPSDAHQLASGRLAVAMTRLTDGKSVVMSEFQSKEDVIQALLCSCFVPGYCGVLPPAFKGVHYVDGGFTCMQPVLPRPCNHTLTVSPFSGEIDICPADTPCMWDMVVSGATLKGNMANSFRIINALYPMALETLEQAYYSGYKDGVHFLLLNDLAPYLTINNVSKGPLNYNQAKMLMHLDTTIEEEEEMEVEKEKTTLTSFKDNKHMQTCDSTEHESTGSQTIQEPPLHFDMVKNVLLSNVVTYLSMFGLPARILSHLLLPLMLSFHVIPQGRQRLELLFRQSPEFVFWAWYFLKHFTVFTFNIFVCSLKKNIKDRVMPIIFLLQWLKIQGQFQALQEQKNSTTCNKFSSSAHSENIKCGNLHRQFITPSQDYKKPKLLYK